MTTWSNRDAAFYDVAVGIAEVVKKLVETHHKRFIEKYIADAESEARLNSSSWISTDPFRGEKRADAENLYKNIYDKLKSVQMEIIQQGLILQQYLHPIIQDETDSEEEEPSIRATEQAFVQDSGLGSEEYERNSERRNQQAQDRVHTSPSQAMQRLTERKFSLSWPGADEKMVVEEMLQDLSSEQWYECSQVIRKDVQALSITKNEQEEEDIVQEIMLTIQRQLPSFRFGVSLSAWLFQITQQGIIKYYQRKR